ncbi:hypothetical protein, partial [Helicobacter sp. UBA3407]|uniref:hypothetical protein n=1 Tax=Helicobacter sp. UBA3407 TaxID=1946588 RepID=UPI00261805CB
IGHPKDGAVMFLTEGHPGGGGGFYLDKISSKLDTIEFQNQKLIREIALLKGEIAKNHTKIYHT